MLTVALGGLGALAVGAVIGGELVDHGVLPGKSLLNALDGACSVSYTHLTLPTIYSV